jgi:transposase InsO family protein
MGGCSLGGKDIGELSGAGSGKYAKWFPLCHPGGFHSDNGSEFINKTLAELLNKLLIRFTKCRPRHSNDNGLVETKNGSVVREALGYAYIPQACAEVLNRYNNEFLNPYINFHRPCFFPVTVTDDQGKVKKSIPIAE